MLLSKKRIYSILEDIAVKLVLHLLKVSSGFQAYLLTQLVEHAFEKIAIPLSNLMIRKGYLFYDSTKGKIQIKKLNASRINNDRDEYNDILNDILQ